MDGQREPLYPGRSKIEVAKTLARKKAIIGAGARISAKFIEKGGADFLIAYNSGRFRMSGHGSTAGLMAYGDANAVSMEIGEFEVIPVVEEIPVFPSICPMMLGPSWRTWKPMVL